MWMPQCAYPIEYHDMYGHMVPWMDPEFCGGMVYPIMYPEIYYKIYPYICKICDTMDNPYIPYPCEAQMEKMVNECYDLDVYKRQLLEFYVVGFFLGKEGYCV